MNEKSLNVIKQYDIEVRHVNRGRGGMILTTNKGPVLFLECVHPDKYYERENEITRAVASNGFRQVDTYIENTEGNIISEDEEGHHYILKRWFEARECNIRDTSDLCDMVRTLARLHTALDQASAYLNVSSEGERCIKNEDLRSTYIRHTKELKMASNYLKNKKNRMEFELLAYKHISGYYEEARKAVGLLRDSRFDARFERVVNENELCHGSYNYHNVMFGEGGVCVTNFDKCKNECQIWDLYQLMRKVMEKYDWELELGYMILNEYDKTRHLTDEDTMLMSALLSFPEKFWKIINYYFNSNKAWIPPKSIDKLKTVISQNEKRLKFIETIG